jgi:hypothetical protein
VSVELRDDTRFAYTLPVAIGPGVRHATADASSQGRIPRVSRLMALAIKFQRLVSQGVVRNYRELAEAGHVSRARFCHIMMLANLAPTIQEALLFLPKTIRGRDSIAERQLRTIAGTIDWQKQMDLFRAFLVAAVPMTLGSHPIHALVVAAERADSSALLAQATGKEPAHAVRLPSG